MFSRNDKIGKFKFNSPENYGINDGKMTGIKKIAIYVGVVLVAFLILFFSFLIPYKAMNKDVAKVENVAPKQTSTSIFLEKDIVYNGNHRIGPTHDRNAIIEKLNSVLPVQNLDAHEIIRNIYFSDKKEVYLTFDDGPSQAITPQILDILNEYDVKATFFVLGKMANANPDLIRREYEEGHYIANHGYSHTYSKIYESKDSVYEEYMETEKKIQEALGNPDYHTYLFRFPGGSSNTVSTKYASGVVSAIASHMTGLGYVYFDWDISSGDAGGASEAQIYNNVVNGAAKCKSCVFLMHDIKKKTVNQLDNILNTLISQGYQFGVLTPSSPTAHQKIVN